MRKYQSARVASTASGMMRDRDAGLCAMATRPLYAPGPGLAVSLAKGRTDCLNGLSLKTARDLPAVFLFDPPQDCVRLWRKAYGLKQRRQLRPASGQRPQVRGYQSPPQGGTERPR